MKIGEWLTLTSLIIDLLKSIVPFIGTFCILWYFRKEILFSLRSGGLKLSALGITVESINQQQQKQGSEESKEISNLNNELESTKKVTQQLQQLQEYTARDKEIFFIAYHFEKTYRVIFPSQMLVLIHMYNNKGEIENNLAKSIFNRTIWAQSMGMSYDNFMGFLINGGMCRYESGTDKFSILPVGSVFLEYLQNNNIPSKLPANDSL